MEQTKQNPEALKIISLNKHKLLAKLKAEYVFHNNVNHKVVKCHDQSMKITCNDKENSYDIENPAAVIKYNATLNEVFEILGFASKK